MLTTYLQRLDAQAACAHFFGMTEADARPARPRAFRLDGSGAALSEAGPLSRRPVVEPQPDPYLAEAVAGDHAAVTEASAPGRRRPAFGWGKLLLSALAALASLAFSVWLWGLVEDFFARSAALGALGAEIGRAHV